MQLPYVRIDSQQSVRFGEKLLLQRDDDDLQVLPGLLSDETGHLEKSKRAIKEFTKVKH